VILSADGTILTNNHVVEGAAEAGSIRVTFADGKSAEAQLLGRDPATDLAVVKAQGVSGLKPVTLGSAKDLHVGDAVLAVGSPLGLEGSVSAGIVSALHRPVNVGTTTLSDAIRPTRRSTPATPAAVSSTRAAASSASTRLSPRSAAGAGRAATSAWASRSRWTPRRPLRTS
jgi:putative serine protease PepD